MVSNSRRYSRVQKFSLCHWNRGVKLSVIIDTADSNISVKSKPYWKIFQHANQGPWWIRFFWTNLGVKISENSTVGYISVATVFHINMRPATPHYAGRVTVVYIIYACCTVVPVTRGLTRSVQCFGYLYVSHGPGSDLSWQYESRFDSAVPDSCLNKVRKRCSSIKTIK